MTEVHRHCSLRCSEIHGTHFTGSVETLVHIHFYIVSYNCFCIKLFVLYAEFLPTIVDVHIVVRGKKHVVITFGVDDRCGVGEHLVVQSLAVNVCNNNKQYRKDKENDEKLRQDACEETEESEGVK